MKYLKTKNLLKFIHRILKILKKIFDETKSFVSVVLTRIEIQQYNKIMKSLFFLSNNFEMQKRQYCAFNICTELVF